MGPENQGLYRPYESHTDALGLTCDRVYGWRLLLEEYGPELAYIKGIHNTVADALSRLEYDPLVNPGTDEPLANFVICKVSESLQTEREHVK